MKNQYKEEAGMGLHDDENVVRSHTQLLTQLDERSKSNMKRLDKHDERIESLGKVYTALTKMESEITHISEKLDNVGIDKKIQSQQLAINQKQLELEESRIEIERKKNHELVSALKSIGKRSFKEKLEDAAMPVLIVIIIYIIVEAAQGGVLY